MKNPALSQALQEKWASGTRKPNPPETYVKSSQTLMEGYESGRLKPSRPFTSQTAVAALLKRDQAKVTAQLRRLAKNKRGTANPPGLSGKGSAHWKARYWKLRAPTGKIIEGWNLSELVRSHAELFDERDVVWKKHQCRASQGLRSLFATNEKGETTVHEWKGWTALRVCDGDLAPVAKPAADHRPKRKPRLHRKHARLGKPVSR